MSQLIFNGIVTGSLYALAALGLVLIFKTSDIVNFAQGEMAMFFTFIAFTLLSRSMPYFVAFILTLIFAGVMGFIIQRTIIRPLGSALISAMIATLGLIMIVNGLAGNIFGFDVTAFPKMINAENVKIGSVTVDLNSLIVIIITIAIMMALFYYFKYTMSGLALRAAAQDPKAAKLMGISVERVITLTWIISAMLAGITGILVAPTTNLSVGMMADVHLKSFCAAVLGGFNSFIGPLVGGLVLGVSENLFGKFVSISWKSVFTFALIIVMLVIKPNGLVGTKVRKKV
ncbi:MAG: branched-chain amino acid ABC transporter permease [Clostridium sp.]|nr:branched-chain amino acid ABC transporter permease [Clostridium sp.]